MNLDDAQKKKLTAWIAEGLKLSDIQKRLSAEFGLGLTYMEVRMLVDDLKLVPKDVEPAVTPHLAAPPTGPAKVPGPAQEQTGASPGLGEVSVKIDQVTRPGALASGRVTFSDGQNAEWYLDQLGRLGLIPQQAGYKPSGADLQEFQIELQNELTKMGL